MTTERVEGRKRAHAGRGSIELSMYGEDGRPLKEKGLVFYVGEVTDARAVDERNPESLLIERESAGDDRQERRRLSSKALLELVQRLPGDEREMVIAYFSGAQSQREIAERLGVSQPAIVEQIQRAVRRLQWLAGHGASFTCDELERNLAGKLAPTEVRVLSIYWRSTSFKRVVTELGGVGSIRVREKSARRLLDGAIAKLRGRMRAAFDALRGDFADVLVDKRHKRRVLLSGVDDFLERACVYEPGVSTWTGVLVAAYRRHSERMGRPFVPFAMTRALLERGVKRRSKRNPETGRWQRAWLGVRLLWAAQALDGRRRAPVQVRLEDGSGSSATSQASRHPKAVRRRIAEARKRVRGGDDSKVGKGASRANRQSKAPERRSA